MNLENSKSPGEGGLSAPAGVGAAQVVQKHLQLLC